MIENQCPRCGGMIPNNEMPGAYPGALSRYEHDEGGAPIEVCSDCGTGEAMRDFQNLPPLPRDEWFDGSDWCRCRRSEES